MKQLIQVYLVSIFILNSGWLSGQLVIRPGSSLLVYNGTVTHKKDLFNNGIVNQYGGTIVFSGAVQAVGGTTGILFNNLTIGAGSTTTLNTAGQSIKGIALSNGTLNSNGNLTLLSTDAQTALISGSGTGGVLGNLIMQCYLDTGFGYKYVSSPFQAATVNEFADDLDLTASFPTFYYYDQNKPTVGWVTDTATSGILSPLRGYAANFGSLLASKTFDIEGVVNNGNVQLTLYNHNQPYTTGFNLVGNPYPSPINWDASSGWTKTNIDDALYFFNASDTNQYTGIYSSYVNGISSDGIASAAIPAMQGFFIHVTDGAYPVSATLGTTNEVREDITYPSFLKSSKSKGIYVKSGNLKSKPIDKYPSIRITARLNNEKISDPAVIYFMETSNRTFDKKLDAFKRMNTDQRVPSLYSFSLDSKRLSINALPLPKENPYKIPLGIKTEATGWIALDVGKLDNLPSGLYVFLVDAQTGVCQNLADISDLRFYMDAGIIEQRFSLVFSWSDQPDISKINGDDSFRIQYSEGKVWMYINLTADERGTVLINNLLGQIILQTTVTGNESIEIGNNLKNGVYIITLIRKTGKQSKTISIMSL